MSDVFDYMFDNEWLQRSDIENLKNSANIMRQTNMRATRHITDLEGQIAQLTLLNEALLRMLEKKGVFARDEFRALLVEVDLEDGVHDGQLRRPATQGPRSEGHCKHCGTDNAATSRFCTGCRRPLFRR